MIIQLGIDIGIRLGCTLLRKGIATDEGDCEKTHCLAGLRRRRF